MREKGEITSERKRREKEIHVQNMDSTKAPQSLFKSPKFDYKPTTDIIMTPHKHPITIKPIKHPKRVRFKDPGRFL